MKTVKRKFRFCPTPYDKRMRELHRKTGNHIKVEIPVEEKMDKPLGYYQEMEKYWNS